MSILEQLKSVLCDPSGKCCITGSDEDRAIVDRALQALAEQPAEQEPVAWMDEFGNVFPLGAQRGPRHLIEPMKPLYPSSQKRTWVGLTDDEIYAIEGVEMKYDGTGDYYLEGEYDFAKAIEAKLKQKNHG